jgi:hypothetical protein
LCELKLPGFFEKKGYVTEETDAEKLCERTGRIVTWKLGITVA